MYSTNGKVYDGALWELVSEQVYGGHPFPFLWRSSPSSGWAKLPLPQQMSTRWKDKWTGTLNFEEPSFNKLKIWFTSSREIIQWKMKEFYWAINLFESLLVITEPLF